MTRALWWALSLAALQLTAQPDDVRRLSAAASVAMRAGDYAAAERHNRELLQVAPQLAEAHINLGLSCFGQKKYSEAVGAFEEGLRVNPELSNGLLFLGISWFNLNRPEKAIAALEKYAAGRPDDLQGHYYLGLSLLGQERFREAEAPLARARRIDPRNTDVLYHLAAAYLGQARQPEADREQLRLQYEAILREIAAIAPDSYRIAQIRAGHYQATGEPAKARAELERLAAAKLKVRGIHYTLGCIYLESREYDKAREQFEAELRLDAPYPRTYLQLAHALIEQGEPAAALEWLAKAQQAEPSNGVAWVEAGRAYRALNRPAEAAASYKSAIGLGEANAQIYYQLALVYRSAGKARESQEALRRSQELRAEAAAGTTPTEPDEAARIEQAREALNTGRYQEAARQFEQIWATSSRCDVPFYAGMAAQRAGDANRAIIGFESAARCNPAMLEARLALAEAYAGKGDDDRALAAYERVLEFAPENLRAMRAAATLYLRHQINEKAAAALEKVVGREPGDVQAIEDLGAAYAATSRFEEAERHFRRVLDLNPYLPSALTGLANVILRNGGLDEAIELLTKAVELAPKAYEPKYVLGSAHAQAGRFAEAALWFEAALKDGSSDPEIYYRLAGAYAKLNREADRRAALEEFSRRKAEAGRAGERQRQLEDLVSRAKAAVEGGDLQGAAIAMEQAVALEPGHPGNLFRLAGLYYDLGRYPEAQERVRAAVDGVPGEWSYHYLAGLVEQKLGNPEAARASLETALKLNPESAEVRARLEQLAAGEQ